MDRIIVDKNSRAVQIVSLSFGKTISSGIEKEAKGIVRFCSIEDTIIRLSSQPSSEVLLPAGSVEYFYVNEQEDLEIVSGNVNIMW